MKNPDRLYQLLPVVHRQRDADCGYPLRDLLRVITEQVDVVESNISQTYENWFIETCQEWVVPYIGDLVGYQVLNDTGEPASVNNPRALQRERMLIPRQDVANTIRSRRRKGTLALLEELSLEATDWPARAVEFYKLLGWTQNTHSPHVGRQLYHIVRFGDTLAGIAQLHQLLTNDILWFNPALNPNAPLDVGRRLLLGWRPARGHLANLRDVDGLELTDGPFDRLSRTVDVRRINSSRSPGFYNIPSVGLFVWRLKSYSVTMTPAFCVDEHPNDYTFSVLGNDCPLFNHPQPPAVPTDIASELEVPTPIRRWPFSRHPEDYYGDVKSLQIWMGDSGHRKEITADKIIVADLAQWQYRPQPGNGLVAVDPVRGRLAFALGEAPTGENDFVWVSYYYGFSTEIGGGEYDRLLSQPSGCKLYQVGAKGTLKTIHEALNRWQEDLAGASPADFQNAVIEITDSGLYEESLSLKLGKNQTLQVRAANGTRPVISVSQTRPRLDALFISGDQGSRVTLDGLLITGRSVRISGPVSQAPTTDAARAVAVKPGDLCDVTIRHCTLVPGWSLDCNCEPCRGEEPSLVLSNTTACVKIEHSILGSIEVEANRAATDPLRLFISDTILDATDDQLPALNGVESAMAYVQLTLLRCTVLGKVLTHEITLAENCIFNGHVCVARRQTGCVRFCYVPPDSRTPRRYECQPDLVANAAQKKLQADLATDPSLTPAEIAAEIATWIANEELRVEPDFNSVRYGTPTYCQLAIECATEISTGADDESEMGVFHDLYQPQRAANLRARLDDYTPAGMNAGFKYAT